MRAKDYRRQAWDKLNGNWGSFALITFIYSLIMGLANGISNISVAMLALLGLVATVILDGPFNLGLAKCATTVTNKEKLRVEMLFSGFKTNFGKAILLGLINTILIILWTLLLIIPGIIKSLSYSMSFFILNDNPDMDANEARKQSMKMMAGNKWKYFCLQLSFIGWFLLCILTLGILLFWVLPYLQTATAEFYQDLKNKANTTNEQAVIEEAVASEMIQA